LGLDGTGTASYQGDPGAPREGDRLVLPLPGDAVSERVRDSAGAWLQQRARLDFESRLERFLALAGQSMAGWRLSSAAGRWGSCNSRRQIFLNWRLIHFPAHLID